ncbi:glycoside hydrolase family protein [Venturia nashicola]|uniref:chitinase n=1 Tax=Venturia nashicola TaxID=86259 RepID=A0A4Z1NZY7_9PEZI|nr:glycoside hydrolase family 16 protein [Venturia nashicola]TLD26079.1 glycoside hydrolase family protein [Venturia nashicola]
MFSRILAMGAILSSVLSSANAQLSTSCNPTVNATCPTDVGLTESPFTTDFTKGKAKGWTAAIGTNLVYGKNGAEFIVKTKTDAPTLTTDFYIFFGYVEVKMRSASGTGVISSVVLASDDLDEIDWEWLGGNNTSVETNYFGKGNTTSYDRAIYYPVSKPNDEMHTYGINWTESAITWSIDGTKVRTLAYSDAVGGKNFPQTPCKVSLGVWAAGTDAQSEGTVTWAGGMTDFNNAPFTMYVEKVRIENHTPGLNYEWSDRTGDYKSIKVLDTITDSNSTSTDTGTTTSNSGGLSNPDGVVSGNSSDVSNTGPRTSASGSASASGSGSAQVTGTNKSGANGLVGSRASILFGVAAAFALL